MCMMVRVHICVENRSRSWYLSCSLPYISSQGPFSYSFSDQARLTGQKAVDILLSSCPILPTPQIEMIGAYICVWLFKENNSTCIIFFMFYQFFESFKFHTMYLNHIYPSSLNLTSGFGMNAGDKRQVFMFVQQPLYRWSHLLSPVYHIIL